MDRIIVGIDISKKKFDAAYMVDNQKWQQKTFDNKPGGFKEFSKWLEENKVGKSHAVMEATGRYGEDLANFLYISGHLLSIVNPAQIKYYARSLLKRAKTDNIDSKIIAEFSAMNCQAGSRYRLLFNLSKTKFAVWKLSKGMQYKQAIALRVLKILWSKKCWKSAWFISSDR
jgi:transposase